MSKKHQRNFNIYQTHGNSPHTSKSSRPLAHKRRIQSDSQSNTHRSHPTCEEPTYEKRSAKYRCEAHNNSYDTTWKTGKHTRHLYKQQLQYAPKTGDEKSYIGKQLQQGKDTTRKQKQEVPEYNAETTAKFESPILVRKHNTETSNKRRNTMLRR
jgi:hypothetical protein